LPAQLVEHYLQANSNFIVDTYKIARCDTVLVCPLLKLLAL
jgi:hypothetical protein